MEAHPMTRRTSAVTDDSILAECPHCGEPRAEVDLVRRNGPIETYRCPDCGTEYDILVSPGLDVELDDSTYAVDVSWSPDEPAAGVVKALREIFPDLRSLPLGQLRTRVADGPPVRRDGLVRVQAEQVRDAALRAGLRATISDPEERGH
jgi:hypothetical protein